MGLQVVEEGKEERPNINVPKKLISNPFGMYQAKMTHYNASSFSCRVLTILTSDHLLSSVRLPHGQSSYTIQHCNYFKLITGNSRTCQGCRMSLHNVDGSIPSQTYDICVARAEKRSFRDSNGVFITPVKESVYHYQSYILHL